ncbi:MAG: hypothetical protein M3Y08_17180, partial [Fibrobacterota bacterium]|nr:hypothetical protein [Fibrobacterota bacterium]
MTLTATPIAGYSFTGWTGDATGTTNPLSVLMDRNKSIAANFTLNKFALTVTATNGTVDHNPPTSPYDYGTLVELRPRETNPAYVFTGWSGTDGSGKLNPFLVTMDKAKSVTANFLPADVKLTLTPTTNGSITAQSKPNGAGFYRLNQIVILSAIPAKGYKVSQWTVGSAAMGNATSLAMYMDGDKTAAVTFIPIPFYTVGLTQVLNGKLKVAPAPGPSGFLENTLVTLTAVAEEGFQFSGWTGSITAKDPVYSFYLNGNKTVSGNFTALPTVTLTVIDATGNPTLFTVKQGVWQSITTTVPNYKGFDVWKETAKANDKVAVTLEKRSSASTRVKISGGNATVTATFLDPKLKVEAIENAKGSADVNVSKPQVRVTTLNGASLTGLEILYYFKAECARNPTSTFVAPAGWAYTIEDADGNTIYGGNWFVRFKYTNTLAGNSSLTTPSGFTLNLTNVTGCATCNIWDRSNDPSATHTVQKWTKTELVPVYKVISGTTNPVEANRLAGNIPAPLIIDPAPDIPPAEELKYVPVTDPIKTASPQPNLTFYQAFPEGDFLVNGSFENDSLAWKKWGTPTWSVM